MDLEKEKNDDALENSNFEKIEQGFQEVESHSKVACNIFDSLQ